MNLIDAKDPEEMLRHLLPVTVRLESMDSEGTDTHHVALNLQYNPTWTGWFQGNRSPPHSSGVGDLTEHSDE